MLGPFIESETEVAAEEQEAGYEAEEPQGRCAAVMSTGRRCPNAALPGSRYCGLDSHQALANQPTDQVGGATAVLTPPDVVPAPVEVPAEDALPAEDRS